MSNGKSPKQKLRKVLEDLFKLRGGRLRTNREFEEETAVRPPDQQVAQEEKSGTEAWVIWPDWKNLVFTLILHMSVESSKLQNSSRGEDHDPRAASVTVIGIS